MLTRGPVVATCLSAIDRAKAEPRSRSRPVAALEPPWRTAMSPATLPRIPALDLDFRRIAGTSATIAIHLAALMLLLAPVQWSPPAEKPDEVDTIRFEEIKVKPID